jgi:crotonobetainyl-CoA:carnitine CoA-transferase CaiB-like acyl-CoA transferase
MTGPLADVRVIDFSHLMAGPWASQKLGDMGADVIKIERPRTGEYQRSYFIADSYFGEDGAGFVSLNRNKRSLTVDLRAEQGRKIVHELVRTADIVLENFRPGVMERLGLGYEELSGINPGLVYCRATGYGTKGPLVDWPGQDLLVQAMVGVLWQTGTRGGPPTPAPTFVADAMTGQEMAFAVLAALHHRDRTGEGQYVEVNMLHATMQLLTQELTAFLNSGRTFERDEDVPGHPMLAAPYGVYETRDGYIALAMNPLPDLGGVLGLPQLERYTDAKSAFEDKAEITTLIRQKLLERTTGEWLQAMHERGIWCGAVLTYGELAEHPQVAENEMVATVHHPQAGDIRLVNVPEKLSKTPGSIRRAPPAIGEHNEEILREMGLTAQEIERLSEAGIVPVEKSER